MTAQELANKIVRIPYHDDAHAEIVLEVAALIEAHDREILYAAADRAIDWQQLLCRQDEWACAGCNECDELRAAILGGKE